MKVKNCNVKENFTDDYFRITLIYICLTMLVPILIILTANLIIIASISKRKSNKMSEYICKRKRKTTYFQRQLPSQQHLEMMNFKQERSKSLVKRAYYVNLDQIINRVTTKANSQAMLTKMLVLISFCFVFLNLPYFISWCIFYYKDVLTDNNKYQINAENTDHLYSTLKIIEIFYLANYCINFYLYFASGSVFRNQIK